MSKRVRNNDEDSDYEDWVSEAMCQSWGEVSNEEYERRKKVNSLRIKQLLFKSKQKNFGTKIRSKGVSPPQLVMKKTKKRSTLIVM